MGDQPVRRAAFLPHTLALLPLASTTPTPKPIFVSPCQIHPPPPALAILAPCANRAACVMRPQLSFFRRRPRAGGDTHAMVNSADAPRGARNTFGWDAHEACASAADSMHGTPPRYASTVFSRWPPPQPCPLVRIFRCCLATYTVSSLPTLARSYGIPILVSPPPAFPARISASTCV